MKKKKTFSLKRALFCLYQEDEIIRSCTKIAEFGTKTRSIRQVYWVFKRGGSIL